MTEAPPDERSAIASDLTEEDVLTILSDECDGDPFQLLRHNQVRYTLATWKANPIDSNLAYDAVNQEINWRSVNMQKSRFEDSLDQLWEEMNGDSDEETDTGSIPAMSPIEFHESFSWEGMKDRAMARKCHQWVVANEDLIFTNDRVLTYDDGLWVEDEGVVSRILRKLLREYHGSNVKQEFLSEYVRSDEQYRVDWEEMGIRGPRVAVENGLLDLVEGELIRDLEPEDYAIQRIPVRWQGIDADAPRWHTFISESVEDDGQDTIQEFSGLCLHTNEYPYKKALMMLGGGDNGKGVYETVMSAMLGRDNVSHDDLSDMAGGRFGLQRLRHKTANMNSDIRGGEIEETSMFKKLTGGDRVRVEPKYETAFEMENPAKLMFAANSVPKVSDDERAFYRRWLFVQFPHRFTHDPDDQFKDAIRGLDDEIIEAELPGVLAWAVKGYQRLHEQERFTGEQNPDEIRQQWNDYQDTTATFVRNYIVGGNPVVEEDDRKMRVDELYRYYEKFIRTTPTAADSKQQLHRYITAEHRYPDAETEVSRTAVKDDEDRDTVRVWDGIYIPRSKRKKIREKFTSKGA